MVVCDAGDARHSEWRTRAAEKSTPVRTLSWMTRKSTFWHVTPDPDFQPDAEFRPRGPDGQQGAARFLSLAPNPAKWLDSEWFPQVPIYLAEIVLPADQYNRTWAAVTCAGKQEIRAWGESVEQAEVLRVVPVEDWNRWMRDG